MSFYKPKPAQTSDYAFNAWMEKLRMICSHVRQRNRLLAIAMLSWDSSHHVVVMVIHKGPYTRYTRYRSVYYVVYGLHNWKSPIIDKMVKKFIEKIDKRKANEDRRKILWAGLIRPKDNHWRCLACHKDIKGRNKTDADRHAGTNFHMAKVSERDAARRELATANQIQRVLSETN